MTIPGHCPQSFLLLSIHHTLAGLQTQGLKAMKRAILAFGFITTTGYLAYILFPLTPPWLLAIDGVIEPLDRCVFNAIREVVPAFLVSSASNTPRAAMPSLHAGSPFLCLCFFFGSLAGRGAGGRW